MNSISFLYSSLLIVCLVSPGSSNSSSSIRRLVVAVDGGTESIRAACFDASNGHLVGKVCSHPYATTFPQPGWAEQDPETWFTSLQHAMQSLMQSVQEAIPQKEDYELCAMAMATTCCSVVALDKDYRPVAPCLLWMDQRSSQEASDVLRDARNDPALLVNSNGQGPISAEWMVPKALWMKRNWKKQWNESIRTICEYQDYLNFQLTGVMCASSCNAATRWHWDGQQAVEGSCSSPSDTPYPGRPLSLYRAVGLEDLAEKLPHKCLPMGAQVGTLTDSAADALHLPRHLPVIQGGPDAFVGMIGLGCTQPGQMCLITGSSHLHCVVAEDGSQTAPGVWGAYRGAPLPTMNFAEGGQSSTGSILRWARNLFGDNAASYEELDAEARTVPPGSDGLVVLETFQGSRTPITDPLARGAFVGLTLSHTRANIWRACMEAVCFGTRACIDGLEAAGHTCHEIVVSGGVTRSDTWLQMHSDVTRKKVKVCEHSENGPLLGCAVLAAVGVGIYPSVHKACEGMIRTHRIVEPNPSAAEKYAAIYNHVYKKMATTLQPIVHSIHNIRGGDTIVMGNENEDVVVSPSLLACDWGDIRSEVRRCLHANLTRLHVDIFDGVFLNSPLALTFGPKMVKAIRSSCDDESCIIDLHICVNRPDRFVDCMAEAGGDTFIFMWEAMHDVSKALDLAKKIKEAGMECGVSINPSTPVSVVFALLATKLVSVVNLLAVEPGFGGQTFQSHVNEKIKALQRWRLEHPTVSFIIMVDGGINTETALIAVAAGAEILVAGSFIFQSSDLSSVSSLLLATKQQDR